MSDRVTPAVSVVIPVYNRCAMVREAIASVLAQRDADFELIVVDDGSTDGTWIELEALSAATNVHASGPPMRIVRTENRGPAAARNTGSALAAAELIAFLDSDDLWAPQKLARQIAFMRDNPEFAIAQCDEVWMRAGRRVNPGLRHRKRAGDFFVDALRTCLISPSAVIMRTRLLRDLGGFDEAMAAAEDYDLWLRVLCGHRAGLLDEALMTRRAGHPGQLSATVVAIDRFRILALLKLLAHADLPPARRHAVCEVLAEKCAIYAKGLTRRGHSSTADFILEVAARAGGSWCDAADDAIAQALETMRALVTGDNGAQSNGKADDIAGASK